jgi:deoxyribodipyrimidine photo-lyase
VPDTPSIVWFRKDLRLTDQPALRAALRRGGPVVPVYLWSPEEEGVWAPGAASRWWLHHALTRLHADLRERGSELIIRRGPASEVLPTLVEETGAAALYWNRRYEPACIERDRRVKAQLQGAGLTVESFNGSLLFEPWDVQTGSGGCYQVFTPFWKRCCELGIERESLPKPRELKSPARWPQGLAIEELGLLPKIPWADGFAERWTPGEAGAHRALQDFVGERIEDYHEQRDRPAALGTSSLSPHLHFGEISPLQVWEAVTARYGPPAPAKKGPKSGPMTFLSEVGWREFAHHVLYHFPHTPRQPLREKFAAFPWQGTRSQERAWQRGRTGYPIVDAGLRELWGTGWMHNRVRMIVGSFLTKDLLISWQHGAAWFWDTLVDADLANNTLGWQWISGCGADAAPYFRIFNPVSQGEKFDPEGTYVRRWVPELSRLPNNYVHRPWEAPAGVLSAAGVKLGTTYPRPIVDHAVARRQALAALQACGTSGP